MKKTVKIISTMLLAIMLVLSIASVTFAAVDINSVLNSVENTQVNGDGDIGKLGGKIVNLIQIVGIVVAAVILLIIGIKYMIGSAEEKADYKKSMIPYIVGALLVFGGTSIVKVIYSLATNLK